MRRLMMSRCAAKGLVGLALSVAAFPALADGAPPMLSAGSAPAAPYWRRYVGPGPGSFGSFSYAIANRPYFHRSQFPAAPNYGPFFGGYGYAPAYFGYPYIVSYSASPAYVDPYSNPVLQATMLENQLRWGIGLPLSSSWTRPRLRHRPSSPAQHAKSVHAQAQGDVWLRKLNFVNAYERYKYAISAASDRPGPYFRLAYALVGLGSFDSAVKYVKQGLDLDPRWPEHGERLDAIFGEDNRLTVLSLTERVADWVRDDIRDPDRIFLMGVWLHFDGDTRAGEFFEAAYRLAGSGDHLLAFLQPAGAASPPTSTSPKPSPPNMGAPSGRPGQAPPPPMEPPLPSAPSGVPERDPISAPPTTPLPSPRATLPAAPGSRTETQDPIPRSFFDSQRRGVPQKPNGASPPGPDPRDVNPRKGVSPALPLPPLPTPDNGGPDPDSHSEATPSGGPVLELPSTAAPAGAQAAEP